MTRATLLVVVLLFVALAAAAARAETPRQRDQALALVREGNRLLDAGDAAGALARFRQAFALVPSPKLHFNFGQALAGLPGREAEAHDEFVQYLDEVPTADPVKRAEANRQLLALSGKLAFLSIRTSPDAVGILVDGKPRGTTPLARPLALSAGAHEVRLAKEGMVPHSEVISLAAGQEKSKDFVLRSVATPPAPPASPASVPVVTAPPVAPPIAPPSVQPIAQPVLPSFAKPSSARPLAAPPASTRAAGQTPATHDLVTASGAAGTSDTTLLEAPRSEPQARPTTGRPQGARLAGLIVAGTGVALEAAGLFVYLEGRAKLNRIKQADAMAAMGIVQVDEADVDYKTWGDRGIALMIAGGTVAATGAVLYLLNRGSTESPGAEAGATTVSFGYLPGAGGQVQLGGRF